MRKKKRTAPRHRPGPRTAASKTRLRIAFEFLRHGKKLRFRKFQKDRREYVRLRFFIDGPEEELRRVASVHYSLRFSDGFMPERVSRDRARQFGTCLWEDGQGYDVEATATFEDDTTVELPAIENLEYKLPTSDRLYYDESGVFETSFVPDCRGDLDVLHLGFLLTLAGALEPEHLANLALEETLRAIDVVANTEGGRPDVATARDMLERRFRDAEPNALWMAWVRSVRGTETRELEVRLGGGIS